MPAKSRSLTLRKRQRSNEINKKNQRERTPDIILIKRATPKIHAEIIEKNH